MSGLNLSYEIDNGGGEISYFEDRCIKEPLQLANIIAGEIVSEILDNAFDIVTKTSNTSLYINFFLKLLLILSSDISGTDWKNFDNVCELKKSDLITQERICLGVVGDIIETVEQNLEEKINELDMKKLQPETLGPYDIITYDTIHGTGGVGDHPFDNKIDCSDEIEPENTRTVEKKSRVTDLIKNSPQVITEYLMIDEKTKKTQDEWEETEEKVIQVIELDDGDGINPKQSTPNNEDDDSEKEILQISVDDGMDIIDLSNHAFKEEEKQIINSQLAKGDQQECTTEQISLRDDNTIIMDATTHSLTEKKSSDDLSENKIKENKFKKKKWNFGTRFWGFLKKNDKHKSTSTSKIDKQ
ncbi:hypothetical protein RN001_004382 [Aquatica leii]|uniref:Uncharacterized protein n=1 Tax=Aquatica leii TaxID=1421715 RepID=A0AAN7PBJ6_9COLE|nr:hypothetical protein RN001_004382 [Aquatica leii]